MALKLNINEPIQLSLLRLDPKVYPHGEGKPPSHMYSVQLPDGQQDKIFLPPTCTQSITELRIQPREWFTICRRKQGSGREFFDVHTSASSSRTVTPQKPAAAAPPPAPTAEQQNRKPMATEKGHTRASAIMGAALISAIDAARQAQQYAQAKGIILEFTPADYRCIAATMYIAATRDPLFHERVIKAAGEDHAA